MEFKRRRRAEDAIEKNRIPGLVGKPASYEEKIKKVGVFDFVNRKEDFSQLVREIKQMKKGTSYFIPLRSK